MPTSEYRYLNDAEKLFVIEDLRRDAGLSGHEAREVLACAQKGTEGAQALVQVLARAGRTLEDWRGADSGVAAAPADGAALAASLAACPKTTLVKWRSFEEELDGIARFVQVRVNAADVKPSGCCVVVPNAQWLQLACKALERRYLACVSTENGIRLSPDPRKAEVSAALLIYSRLKLLAEPNDPLSWRLWVGAGQHDLGASAWTALCGLLGSEPGDAFGPDQLARAATAGIEASKAIGRGLAFVKAKSGLRGFSLMRACGADGAPTVARYLEQVAGDADAVAMLGLVRELVAGPVLVDDPVAVRVCTLDAVREGDFDIVCLIGCVDGFVPGRLETGAAARFMQIAASSAAKELVLSYFCTADKNVASKMRMNVARSRNDRGKEVALLKPSPLLALAGDACPGSLSGDAFLARL